ncbi:ferredoxin [Candidatus Woesearchaeota archaeon CG10_big_fil_rev_8_21_14_0_10_45_16]|nr:MAG: ferredoxin [Candidatus Woesearchaeota archaeon CG10_big_fil_rev_8_21_14_0_10_45_16]
MPKIIHYRDNCIGCNSCVEHAPKQWRISEEDGKSKLIGSTEKRGICVLKISEVELEKNELAARDCPVKIIKIVK